MPLIEPLLRFPLSSRTDSPGKKSLTPRVHRAARCAAATDCRFSSDAMDDGMEAPPGSSSDRSSMSDSMARGSGPADLWASGLPPQPEALLQGHVVLDELRIARD